MDNLYDLIQNKEEPYKIFSEIEKVLCQKLDRLEFSQIIQTKANTEDLLKYACQQRAQPLKEKSVNHATYCCGMCKKE